MRAIFAEAGFARLRSQTQSLEHHRRKSSWSRAARPDFLRKLRGLDVQDLVLQGLAARGLHLDGFALLPAHDRLADRGLVRELVLRRVRLRGADDVVLDGLLFADTSRSFTCEPTETTSFSMSSFVMTRAARASPQDDAMLEQRLVVLGVVVLGVLGDVAELTRERMRSATSRRLSFDRCSISSLSFLKPSGVRITSFTFPASSIKLRGAKAPSRPAWYLRGPRTSNVPPAARIGPLCR